MPRPNPHHGAMATPGDHELIDVGDGRRLDRFGSVLLDRPCPPAEWWPQRDPGAWPSAHARFDRAVEGAVDHGRLSGFMSKRQLRLRRSVSRKPVSTRATADGLWRVVRLR